MYKYKRIHFIGIGGIGVSALARYYKDKGAVVSGSDTDDTDLTKDLRSEGINVMIGHKSQNINDDIECVIYTIAIDKDNNEEYTEAKKKIKRLLSYPEALGELTKKMKTIAICGTHGKTTTTAMTYTALKEAGMSPTLIVGSLIDHEGKKTNYIKGVGEWLIIEACEYKRSFLNYEPEYILVTNIDEDHLDYYKDIKDIREAFLSFAKKLSNKGRLIIHTAEEIVFAGMHPVVADDTIKKEDIKLTVIGDHNKSNAQLVVALGVEISNYICESKEEKEIFNKNILKGLKSFIGTWRRMEYRGYSENGAIVYDDYAHHPNEMIPTLTTLREHYPDKKIVLAFQPHLQSRTHAFYEEFIDAMMLADIVYVLPIYHARSEYDYGLNNYKIVASIIDRYRAEGKDIDECKAYTLGFDHAKEELLKYDNYHVIVTMGAGKNNVIADELVKI